MDVDSRRRSFLRAAEVCEDGRKLHLCFCTGTTEGGREGDREGATGGDGEGVTGGDGEGDRRDGGGLTPR